MLLFGHRFIPSETFYHIASIEHIKHTPPNAVLYLDFSEENLDIIRYMQDNNLSYLLHVNNVTEAIYAAALGALFITTTKPLAKTIQNLAENYLFDTKVLVHLDTEDEIEEYALLGIDGAIFGEAIVKIS